jgi:elongation factor Ts
MSEISAELVRDLREATNLGMMECKRALTETNGDKDKAIRLLRERGLVVAQKKSTRAANQGLVTSFVAADGSVGSLVEINCETDFVARNDSFIKLANELAGKAAKSDASLAETEKALLVSKIAEIGENLVLRRNTRFVRAGTGAVASYIHLGGKIGVLVEIACGNAATTANPKFAEMVKDVCMQIAAANPAYLEPKDVPADVIASEREIYAKQVKDKPANIIDKIVDGKMRKYYEETCLLNQAFIKEQKQTVQQVLQAVSKTVTDTLTVKRFARYQIGQAK